MKNPKHIFVLFLLLFLIQTTVQANQIPTLNLHPDRWKEDTNRITFQHNKSGKTCTIYAEQKVKVWMGNRMVKGIFKKTKGENIVVLTEGQEREIPLTDITKIKAYEEGNKKLLGILLKGIGLITVFFGALSLVVGLVSLATGSLGFIVIIAVPFLLIPGFLLYKLGENISGKILKLNGKWSIKS